MKISCLTTFLDGKDRFEKDDQRTVSDERGSYFIAQGWAAEQGAEPTTAPATGDVTLDVKDAIVGQVVKHG